MPSFHLLRNEILRAVTSPLTNGHSALWIRPTIAGVYLTSFCNSRCNFCDFWKNDRNSNELTSEQWGVVFSRLKAFGIGFVGVNASGEMFTRNDVFDILGHLCALNLNFGVNSNATLFTSRKAKRLSELGPRAVTIGLDSIGDEGYFSTRGLKRGFSKVIRNIANLKEAGITNIGIGSVMMTNNVDHWSRICDFALEKKLSSVRFTAYHDSYFNPTSDPACSKYATPDFIAKIEQEIEKLLDIKRKTGIVRNSELYLRNVPKFYKNQKSYFPTPCLQGSNRIEIDVYGNVTLCSFETNSLGNLVTQDMEEIWQSEVHHQARNNAYYGKCARCYLSCYAEENFRLSPRGFLPTLGNSFARGLRLFRPRHV